MVFSLLLIVKMNYGICLLSVVPCRKEASNTSELVTQLLFGETYEIAEESEGWYKISTTFDAYVCWLNKKQHNSLSEASFNKINSSKIKCNGDLVQIIKNKKLNTNIPITIGSSLPLLKEHDMQWDDHHFSFDGTALDTGIKNKAQKIIQTSYLFLNSPYLWGGKSPFGIDCSGFTQLVFKLNGHKIPRDAAQQVEIGSPLSFVEEAEAGDLAFFDNEEGRIVHVGILLDNQSIIHSSGQVRIDRFDHYGIFHSEHKKYSHNLRVIKRIL
jgi:gamma-D-glutamyl-L-lysine dipeptidyl-peptidase